MCRGPAAEQFSSNRTFIRVTFGLSSAPCKLYAGMPGAIPLEGRSIMPDTFVTPTAAPPKDMLGCVSSLLSKDIQASTGGLKPHRKCMRDAHVEHIDMPA